MLASCLTRYAEIQEELDKSDLLLVYYSRENQERYAANPLFAMLEHQGEQVRKYLRELKLTSLSQGKNNNDDDEDKDDSELGKLFSVINTENKNGGQLLKPLKIAGDK
jgi:hypothetical protein